MPPVTATLDRSRSRDDRRFRSVRAIWPLYISQPFSPAEYLIKPGDACVVRYKVNSHGHSVATIPARSTQETTISLGRSRRLNCLIPNARCLHLITGCESDLPMLKRCQYGQDQGPRDGLGLLVAVRWVAIRYFQSADCRTCRGHVSLVDFTTLSNQTRIHGE